MSTNTTRTIGANISRNPVKYVSPSEEIVERLEVDRGFLIIRTNLWEREVCTTVIDGVGA